MSTEIRGITHYGRVGEVLNNVRAEDWAFYDLADIISDQLAEYMEDHEISKAELARRLGKSRSWVTQVLRGDKNMTLKTLAEVLMHLEAKLEMKVAAKEENVQWVGVNIQTQIRATARRYQQGIYSGEYHRVASEADLYQGNNCPDTPMQAAA